MKRFTIGAGLAVAIGIAVAAPAHADGIQPVDISVSLSRKAAVKLAALAEGITVSASYSGDPKKSAEKHAGEIGLIDLGEQTRQLPGKGGAVHLSGPQVDGRRLGWIEGPVLINVNVFSARKSAPDNLLACDFIDGPLPVVSKAPIALHCSLIEENKSTRTLP